MNMTSEKNNKKYKLVPPDGGWAYVIFVACVLMYAPTGGFRPAFSLMYHDLMEEIGMASTKTGFVAGCNMMAFSLSGYLASPLLKVMSVRQLALLATAFYNTGAFCSAFAQSFTTFTICQSLLQNIGYGILYNLVFTCLKDYFSKKRLRAAMFVQAINAISSVLVPFVIKYATDVYGHRGMLLIISAISMQAFVGVSLLQPVAWHLKREEVEDGEEINASSNKCNTDEKVPSTDGPDKKKEENEQSVLKGFFKSLVDVNVLKEFGLTRTCFGLSTVMVADFSFSLMLTKTFYAKGMSREYVTSFTSLIATGDLATRIILTFFSEHLKKLGSKELFAVGSFVAFIARSGFLLSESKSSIQVFLTLTGIARSFGTTLIPIVIADSVSAKNYTASVGINLLIIGLLNLSIGPILGAVRDYTNSYELVLGFLCSLFLAVSVLFAVDIRLQKKRSKKE
ncbi:monocarboxylate transporter 2 isoform X1 [Amyelois transitella]|uniref:monocarboxylate transporter 2 isoform X1 n=1 Tax=Amyelois transitella TaxID=680683 RepID=UPI00298FB799|nr:monocarboxylate transporter 2 isoform X1 [Amyelois transitella]